MEIPVSRIRPNPRQPRSDFSRESLQELASSIREHGVLQPILLRALSDGNYELVSGERRLRASEIAGLKTLPSILVDPEQESGSLTIALVENVQRSNLNAIELAKAYFQLNRDFGRTQDDIARTVGKSRPHVANTLRLLELSDLMQKAVSDGSISAGHARALLMVSEDSRNNLYERILKRELSVRQTESAARKIAEHKSGPDGEAKRGIGGADDLSVKAMVREMEKALESSLGRKATIERSAKGKGSLVLEFYDDRDLESLVERLRQK